MPKHDLNWFSNMDQHPFHGTLQTDFDAAVILNDNTRPLFSQIDSNVTPGKTYHIYKVKAYGTACDFYFRDDSNKIACLADLFFTGSMAPATAALAHFYITGDETENEDLIAEALFKN